MMFTHFSILKVGAFFGSIRPRENFQILIPMDTSIIQPKCIYDHITSIYSLANFSSLALTMRCIYRHWSYPLSAFVSAALKTQTFLVSFCSFLPSLLFNTTALQGDSTVLVLLDWHLSPCSLQGAAPIKSDEQQTAKPVTLTFHTTRFNTTLCQCSRSPSSPPNVPLSLDQQHLSLGLSSQQWPLLSACPTLIPILISSQSL